jgi:hypothetical protein
MYPIKHFLQLLANLPVSIYLRNTLGIQPKYYKEPALDSSVSDLFFWRSDKVWRTRFDFLNLPSVLCPEQNTSDNITLIFYNQQGQIFHQEKVIIPPLQKIIVQVEDIIGDNVGFGSMACFHETLEDFQSIRQTRIVERGFVAYRRVTDDSPLWSYVHGAAYVLAKSPDQEQVQTIRRALSKNTLYQPQLSLSDCDKFDLIYINPNDSDLEINVRALNQTSKVIREESGVLPPHGVKYIFFDNKDRNISRVENESRAYMLRPFILRYYETHFDILHG